MIGQDLDKPKPRINLSLASKGSDRSAPSRDDERLDKSQRDVREQSTNAATDGERDRAEKR